MKNSIVNTFMKEHSDLFCDGMIVRGLYLRISCTELFILERREWRNKHDTFVFEFDCGNFASCNTEVDAMEKYLMMIPNADRADYITF